MSAVSILAVIPEMNLKMKYVLRQRKRFDLDQIHTVLLQRE